VRTVMITGASGGLGVPLASEFGARGYDLVLHHNKYELPCADSLFTVRGDLKSSDTIWELAEFVFRDGLDVLVNNAGIYAAGQFDSLSSSEIRDVIEVNLIAPMLLTRLVWKALKQNSGIVVNINSLAGLNGSNGETAYCASKHGLAGFSKALQFDGTRDGVRVLDVFVGAMKTAMTAYRAGQENFIDPVDVARTIVSLCDNRNSLRITEITLNRRNY